MTYNKESGEVTIHDQQTEKPKKIIKSMDEALKYKQDLYEELELDDDAMPKGKSHDEVNQDELAKKIMRLRTEF